MRLILMTLLAAPSLALAVPGANLGDQLECFDHPVEGQGVPMDGCMAPDWLDHEYQNKDCAVNAAPVCYRDNASGIVNCPLDDVDMGYGAKAEAFYADEAATGDPYGWIVVQGRVYNSAAQMSGQDFCCVIGPGTHNVFELYLQGTDNDDTLAFESGARVLEAPWDPVGGTILNDLLAEQWGHGGDDAMTGSPSFQSAFTEYLHGGDDADTIDGQSGDDDICGGNGDDVLRGGDGNDRMDGERGSDEVYGEGDGDLVSGGWGSDLVDGGAGEDHVGGGDGVDTVRGGDASDLLCGHGSTDVLYGEGGDDLMLGGAGIDFGQGGAGSDTCYLDAAVFGPPCETLPAGSPSSAELAACSNVN